MDICPYEQLTLNKNFPIIILLEALFYKIQGNHSYLLRIQSKVLCTGLPPLSNSCVSTFCGICQECRLY